MTEPFILLWRESGKLRCQNSPLSGLLSCENVICSRYRCLPLPVLNPENMLSTSITKTLVSSNITAFMMLFTPRLPQHLASPETSSLQSRKPVSLTCFLVTVCRQLPRCKRLSCLFHTRRGFRFTSGCVNKPGSPRTRCDKGESEECYLSRDDVGS